MLAVITALSATAIQYGNDQARAQNAEAKARRAVGFNGSSRPANKYDGDSDQASGMPPAGHRQPGDDQRRHGSRDTRGRPGLPTLLKRPRIPPRPDRRQPPATKNGPIAEAAPEAPAAPAPRRPSFPPPRPSGPAGGRAQRQPGGAFHFSGRRGPLGRNRTAFGQLSAATNAFKVSAMRGQAAPGRATASRPSLRGRGRGIAERQLTRSAQYSSVARTGTVDETNASNATSAFDNAKMAGTAITGAGAGVGGEVDGGQTTGTPNQPSPGGPIESTTPDTTPTCGAGTHIENGVCMPDQGENVTEWQPLVDTAWNLVKIAGILMIAAYLFGLLAKASIPYVSWIAYYIAKACYIGAMLAAGTAAVLGLYIAVGHGQWMQGLILTAIGSLIAYLAYQASEFSVNPAATSAPEPIAAAAAGEVAAKADALGETPVVHEGTERKSGE